MRVGQVWLMAIEERRTKMNLTVRINGKEYKDKCIQGITFSEEYNETLDSATISITHEKRLVNLRPYDDVYIYDSNYKFEEYISKWIVGGDNWDGYIYDDNGEIIGGLPFYRHLLVDQFTEDIINLSQGIYSYKIELMSETKGLEVVQLPNLSVTQPLLMKDENGTQLKVTVFEYIERYVNLYSPKIKKYNDAAQKTWEYKNKYSVSPDLKVRFGNIYSQDFTRQNPNLRDVLSELMVIADCIPYVKDNVIYAKDITKRRFYFDIAEQQNSGKINYVSGTMSSSGYCDGVRRQYNGALSQDGTSNFVEKMGFRSENSIMCLEDMHLKTTYPIYKINKIYMCYYKECNYHEVASSGTIVKNYDILCKQDISKLVKLDNEWGLLNQDWSGFNPQTVDDLASYKLSTVHYAQGSNIIDGWGTKYTQITTGLFMNWQHTKTYIENMFNFMDSHYPFGIHSEQYYIDKLNIANDNPKYLIPVGIRGAEGLNISTKFKGLFFEIEYSGFYSGALVHSKDNALDNIINNDNSSASLALLEKDGINQKEKLNRMANKTYSIKSRCFKVSDVLGLGDYTSIGDEDDIIIYHREYSIYNNEIKAAYIAVRDYVLKDYYTSVYSKYRTYQLMSYGESVERAENRKVFFVLSKKRKFKDENTFFTLPTKLLLSAFNPSNREIYDYGDIKYGDNVNAGGYITGKISDEKSIILTDEHTFTSGNSLCFNVAMPDNISGGNYIKKFSSDYRILAEQTFLELLGGEWSTSDEYVIGSVQDWYNVVDSDKTGFAKDVGFYVQHNIESVPHITIQTGDLTKEDFSIREYKELQKLPKKDNTAQYGELKSIIFSTQVSKTIDELNSKLGIDHDVWQNVSNIEDLREYIGNYVVALIRESDTSQEVVYILFLEDVDEINSTITTTDIGWGYRDSEYWQMFESGNVNWKNRFGVTESLYKDNKERINMTFQLEPISEDSDVYLSNLFVKLSDLASSNNKVQEDITKDVEVSTSIGEIQSFFVQYSSGSGIHDYFGIENSYVIGSETSKISDLVGKTVECDLSVNFQLSYRSGSADVLVAKFLYRAREMTVGEDNLVLKGDGLYNAIPSGYSEILGDIELYKDGDDYKLELHSNTDAGRPRMISLANLIMKHPSTSIIHKNMFVKFDSEKINKETIYKEIKFGESTNWSNSNVDDVFEVRTDEYDQSYIYVNLSGVPSNTKSVQYWFFDNNRSYEKANNGEYIYVYTPKYSSYKFVFGVNITSEDLNRQYVKIYISEMTNRDTRVYDNNSLLIGNIHNCINDSGEYEEPESYVYDPIVADSEYFNISASVNNSNNGTVVGSGNYIKNDTARLVALPLRNTEFLYWDNDQTDTNPIKTIQVKSTESHVANFSDWHDMWQGKEYSYQTSIDSEGVFDFKEVYSFTIATGWKVSGMVNDNEKYTFNDIEIPQTATEESPKRIYYNQSGFTYVNAYINNGALYVQSSSALKPAKLTITQLKCRY